jgi:hypothetical protein
LAIGSVVSNGNKKNITTTKPKNARETKEQKEK